MNILKSNKNWSLKGKTLEKLVCGVLIVYMCWYVKPTFTFLWWIPLSSFCSTTFLNSLFSFSSLSSMRWYFSYGINNRTWSTPCISNTSHQFYCLFGLYEAYSTSNYVCRCNEDIDTFDFRLFWSLLREKTLIIQRYRYYSRAWGDLGSSPGLGPPALCHSPSFSPDSCHIFSCTFNRAIKRSKKKKYFKKSAKSLGWLPYQHSCVQRNFV